MAGEYNLTDKKVSPTSTDRRRYYAPSAYGNLCPLLKLDTDGNPAIIKDMTTGNLNLRCACTETAPFCSYHLATTLTEKDTGEIHQECHRYLPWHNDTEKYVSPVDTHERQLKLKGNRLGWF